ncbi:cyclic peptide export ABC transporter [Teredinibacter purpureus]|uniref:cyclic peptide export ABC transporter n=1 Tax=Teredinibacter purpureus TaxID=2731756 RepID=UPI0005F8969C|nr:cyclic peptide export ABC transporter [Teredinibacter purpureus]
MKTNKQKLSIVGLLYKKAPRLLIFSVSVGAIAGALYSLIIPFVIQGIAAEADSGLAFSVAGVSFEFDQSSYAAMFFITVTAILFTKLGSVILVNSIAKSAAADLKMSVADTISRARTDSIENVGFSRLLNILSDDVNSVANAAITIPLLVVSFVTILGMLGYLAFLNISVFGIVVGAIVVGLFMFQLPVTLAQKKYEKARAIKDVIQEGVRGLVMGAYELKLNGKKSERFRKEELLDPVNRSVRLEKIADAIFHFAGTSSDLLSFFIIGSVVFILPTYMTLDNAETYGVVMALLYIAGPLAHILGMMQQFKVGQIAMIRIEALYELEEEMQVTETDNIPPTWHSFGGDKLTYQYPNSSSDRTFSLAPISVDFKPGQVNFIVGGNGSGKTTLSKLLSLHYLPSSGNLYFDGVCIDRSNIAAARERISVIYSDYYLFSKIYCDLATVDMGKVNTYLNMLGLSGKTELIDGRFTTTDLSDGQRRRLALMVALLEDKDIYVFDEWAADQDPTFKKIFYQSILPEMRKDNKLVIVITHDDRYFNHADRVITMEDGRVNSIQEIKSEALNRVIETKGTVFEPLAEMA